MLTCQQNWVFLHASLSPVRLYWLSLVLSAWWIIITSTCRIHVLDSTYPSDKSIETTLCLIRAVEGCVSPLHRSTKGVDCNFLHNLTFLPRACLRFMRQCRAKPIWGVLVSIIAFSRSSIHLGLVTICAASWGFNIFAASLSMYWMENWCANFTIFRSFALRDLRLPVSTSFHLSVHGTFVLPIQFLKFPNEVIIDLCCLSTT